MASRMFRPIVRGLSTSTPRSSFLKGTELYRKDGSSVKADEHLKNKVIALYFSAGWCRSCRMFTPKLKKFYEEIAGKNKENLEVVWVSRDKTAEDQVQYFQEHQGDWVYIKFGSPLIKELLEKYDVKTIPALRVVDKEGKVLVENARNEVEEKSSGDKAVKLFKEWKGKK
uniref:Thioredoxin domain-containing protein n=1 Tax=Plectus sambesii TaxID=2011161 RepID=A0A914V7L1_9BILA